MVPRAVLAPLGAASTCLVGHHPNFLTLGQNTFTGVKFNIDTVAGTTPDDKDAIGKYKVTGEDGANVREDAGADFEQVGELANGVQKNSIRRYVSVTI